MPVPIGRMFTTTHKGQWILKIRVPALGTKRDHAPKSKKPIHLVVGWKAASAHRDELPRLQSQARPQLQTI